MRASLALAVLFASNISALCTRAIAQPQMGLRLDSRSSLQWDGNTLYMEGPADNYMQLPVARIVDVFPGPVKGTFAVLHSKGIGMLLGSELVPGDAPIEVTEMTRSARPDVLFACVPAKGSRQCNRIVELRVGNQAREVARSAVGIKDFDTDAAGHLVILYEDDQVVLLSGAQPIVLNLSPEVRTALSQRRGEQRVFIDAAAQEIALYAGALFRFDVKTKQWRHFAVDTNRDALVRQAVSRRIRLEERFSIRSQRP